MKPVLCKHVPDRSLYIICVFFYFSRIRNLVAMATEGFDRLKTGKVEIGYLNSIFAEMFIE